MTPKDSDSLSVWHPAFILATWFGSGLLPKIPGTWGSAAALPFAWVIMWAGGPWALLFAALLVFLVGLWAAAAYSRHAGVKDAGPIVIDEVAGQWLTLLPAGLDPVMYFVGFLLFRFADILKPWPARWADHRLEGAPGVMFDDIFAAVYSGLALYAILWLMG